MRFPHICSQLTVSGPRGVRGWSAARRVAGANDIGNETVPGRSTTGPNVSVLLMTPNPATHTSVLVSSVSFCVFFVFERINYVFFKIKTMLKHV